MRAFPPWLSSVSPAFIAAAMLLCAAPPAPGQDAGPAPESSRSATAQGSVLASARRLPTFGYMQLVPAPDLKLSCGGVSLQARGGELEIDGSPTDLPCTWEGSAAYVAERYRWGARYLLVRDIDPMGLGRIILWDTRARKAWQLDGLGKARYLKENYADKNNEYFVTYPRLGTLVGTGALTLWDIDVDNHRLRPLWSGEERLRSMGWGSGRQLGLLLPSSESGGALLIGAQLANPTTGRTEATVVFTLLSGQLPKEEAIDTTAKLLGDFARGTSFLMTSQSTFPDGGAPRFAVQIYDLATHRSRDLGAVEGCRWQQPMDTNNEAPAVYSPLLSWRSAAAPAAPPGRPLPSMRSEPCFTYRVDEATGELTKEE